MSIHFEDARKHKEKIKRLFLAAFPRDERPPIGLLYWRQRQKKASFRAVMDGEKFVGLALICGTEKVQTLMFLAIEEMCRGMGYGGEVLKRVKEEYRDVPFFLCAEPLDEQAENAKERIDRLRFYAHNGFTEIGLMVQEAGVPYTVLTPGTPLSRAQYLEAVKAFFGKVYYHLIIK